MDQNDNALIEILQRGIKFLVYTSNRLKKEPVTFTFCHKNAEGSFIDGLTTEGILTMLISRQHHLVEKEGSTENVQALLFLKQAFEAINKRKNNKWHQKNEYKKNGLSVSPAGE